MSDLKCIRDHKTGSYGTVYDMGLPWEVCANDEEMIEYLNYCFEVVGQLKAKMKGLSLFKDGDCALITSLMGEINGAHNRINSCHKVLSGKLSPVMKKYIDTVYTGKLSQGKHLR